MATNRRFSLTNLLLLTTLAAMALGLWVLYRKQASLRAENQRVLNELHQELGWQPVPDATQLHAGPVHGSLNPFRHFRFRVYVPPNGRGEWRLQTSVTEPDGRPRGGHGGSGGLRPGHTTVDLFVYREAAGDAWNWDVRTGNGGASGLGPLPPWFAEDGRVIGLLQYSTPPEGLPPGDSINLTNSTTTHDDGTTLSAQLSVQWRRADETGEGPR